MPLRTNAARPCLSVSVRVSCLALAASALALAAEKEADTPFCRIFDTGTRFVARPSAEDVAKRTGWQQIPDGDLTHKFRGDVALVNDRLTAILSSGACNLHVYSRATAGICCRGSALIFGPSEGRGAVALLPNSFRAVENTPGAVAVEALYHVKAQPVARFRLTTGEGVLEIRPSQGADSLLTDSAARYVVVPEFFADDMVLDTKAAAGAVLPVESHFLRLLDGGDAMEMWVSQAPLPKATVGGSIHLVSGKSVWLAFLEEKGIWHSRAAGAKDDWQPPFPAKWRCSMAGKDGLAVSYDYEKGPPAGVALPDGPTVIYPIDRTKATPLTTILPMDVMRNTLGVGPCQYVLQAEGLASEANPTPEQVSHWVEQQFKRKKDKAARDEIKDRLAQMVDHVARVQARIGQYGESAKQLRALCQKHEGAERCLAIVSHLEQAAAIKDDLPKAAKRMADGVVALIGEENALEECQKLGEAIRAIGSAQDAALARCRLHVRRLRAECASHPASPLSKELAPLIERMLQGK
ncbi:MAG TPA: hypothetical protein P5532_15490 [Planctomycetota bacterium]|nr:hypothetical protein [Planctomycetota bacterium]